MEVKNQEPRLFASRSRSLGNFSFGPQNLKVSYFFALFDNNYSSKKNSERIIQLLHDICKKSQFEVSKDSFQEIPCRVKLPFDSLILKFDKELEQVLWPNWEVLRQRSHYIEEYNDLDTINRFIEEQSPKLIFLVNILSDEYDLWRKSIIRWYKTKFQRKFGEGIGPPYVSKMSHNQRNGFLSYRTLILENEGAVREVIIWNDKGRSQKIDGLKIHIFAWDDLRESFCPLHYLRKNLEKALERSNKRNIYLLIILGQFLNEAQTPDCQNIWKNQKKNLQISISASHNPPDRKKTFFLC